MSKTFNFGFWQIEYNEDNFGVKSTATVPLARSSTGNDTPFAGMSGQQLLVLSCDTGDKRIFIYQESDSFRLWDASLGYYVIYQVDSGKKVKLVWYSNKYGKALDIPNSEISSFYKLLSKGKKLNLRISAEGFDKDLTLNLVDVKKIRKYLPCFN